ncbi:AmmeMemoRadiSam system radical SAM enzyme [Sinanaerobacter chloroacetimidivorans]|uniref:AmmeMemoRadiSam system radical SAM enzyme n=1 Tax=Sinanaerobacter chloroacetimidivorans TaxID=2818044 RepID=A0A8J7W1A1_9FIRM|nr:AmmeMemoRadiSam system radical SAM enzyme [Sinanaerobacter chloroacetimidivorans]MBR0597095.1 AmmeMemoRadiSam system radical SAM enzyme [Sinanaerobacter chloroacetimidivorans]
MTDHKEAMFYHKEENESVRCFLCPHQCSIPHERVGVCGVRQNIGGTLYALNYECVSSVSLDPIEKKPLKNFYPGSLILSVGSIGCNLKCPFCQNHSIARVKAGETETARITGKELVEKALEWKPRGNIGIAYTYNEPSVWYEFVYETAKLAKEKGLLNVLVTNGFISPEPMERLLPCIDAMNIDLKAYQEAFYKNVVKGGLQDVKRVIEMSAKHCHVEITTLIIPDLNDSREEISEMAKWIASISPDIPLHLSRYFPRYEMQDKPPTAERVLIGLAEEAEKYLKYVYLGNV